LDQYKYQSEVSAVLKLFLLFYICFVNICFAGEVSPSYVNSIVIEGNLRIDQSTIEDYLFIKKSKHYSEILADQSIKKLFETGLFSDVKISFNHGKLLVIVKENPVINKITFEGNKKVTRNTLVEQMTLKARGTYAKTKLQQDINKLIELYHRQGCYDIKINPKMIELDNNRINLVFEITEGPKTLVKNIYFIGNKVFSSNDLKSIIHTKETKWYKFWSSADNYDSDIVEVDKQMLQRFYGSQGYFDSKIISAAAELSPERDGFIITFSIEEGEKYNLGAINVENRLKVDIASIMANLTTKTGDIFNIEEIENSVDILIKGLNDLGFAFVNVEPEFERDPEKRIVNIKYLIEESAKAYVNKINIIGNVRTEDKVIRREMKLAEGDPFNSTKLERSEQFIKDLDYFKIVEFSRSNSPEKPGNVDIEIKLEEKSTAKFNLGGGIQTEGKKISPMIRLSLDEDNLFGTGKRMGISVEKSIRNTSGDISFADPYFLDKELVASISLSGSSQSNKVDLFPYQHNRVGGTTSLGYQVTDHLAHTVRYSLIQDKITKVTPGAIDLIQLKKGSIVTSLIGHSLLYDKTNSRRHPTKGYWLKFDQSIAGLGGYSKFINHEAGAGYYYPINKDKIVLSIISSVGNSFAYVNQKKIIEQAGYNLGGIGSNGLRGFESGGIGPRTNDKRRDSLGGTFFYKSSAEITFPLGFSKDLDIHGVTFFDAGSLQNANLPKEVRRAKKGEIFEDKSLRMSTGFGIVWNGPLGPIKVYVPFVLAKKPYDVTEKFHVEFFNMDF
jgi:outer membrane protein insertion porin family